MEQFRDKHLVVITGGTGLAPVRSMLNMLAADPGFAKSVHLISGFKNEDGIVFHSELEAWEGEILHHLRPGQRREGGLAHRPGHHLCQGDPLDSFDGDYAVVVVGPLL